jgi:hypothetical protein
MDLARLGPAAPVRRYAALEYRTGGLSGPRRRRLRLLVFEVCLSDAAHFTKDISRS